MAWTVQKTMNVGDAGSSADWNTYVRDDVTYLWNKGGLWAARMTRVAALSALAAAVSTTQVPFDTVDFDFNSSLTTGASAKYTCPVAELYFVHANMEFTANAANNPENVYIMVFRNGAEARRGNAVTIRTAQADTWDLQVSGLLNCAAGDTLDIRLLHQIGAGTTPLTAGATIAYAEFKVAA